MTTPSLRDPPRSGGEFLERFEPYLITDAQNNPQVIQPRRKALVKEHNIHTILGLPLQIRQKIIGRIGLLIQDPQRVFTPEAGRRWLAR